MKKYIPFSRMFYLFSITVIQVGRVAQLYSDWLRAGRSGDRIPVRARFSAPVQTGPGVHPVYCTLGTGYFPGAEA
jgi:hypothetical protein